MSATSNQQSAPITTIDLLRHGVCEGGNIYRGSIDVELLEEGLNKMDQVTRRYQNDWDRVITSPLQRCQKFAKLIAKRTATPMLVDDRWREIHFGQWEGQNIETIFEKYPKESYQYYVSPDKFTPPGGESIKTARHRIVQAYEQVLEQHPNEHLLIVQHGGTIRLLLSYILNMPLSHTTRIDVPYACLTRIRIHHHDGDYIPTLLFHLTQHIAE